MVRKDETKTPRRSVAGRVLDQSHSDGSALAKKKRSDAKAITTSKMSNRSQGGQIKPRKERNPSKIYGPALRADFVISVLGNQQVSDLLAVSKSQPSRWRSGSEVPSPVVARRLVDVDYVLARFLLMWDPSLATDWFSSPNGFLDGATPIDVIMTKGSLEVIEALEAEASGAYA
jgi:hypothetical protein